MASSEPTHHEHFLPSPPLSGQRSPEMADLDSDSKGSFDTLPLTPPAMSEGSSQASPEIRDEDVEIVIAHYNENLDWLIESSYASNCVIYSKGDPPSAKDAPLFSSTVNLPNIGRETHTYLTHLATNYDTLSPITLLLQGDIHETNAGTPAHTDLPLSSIITLAHELKPNGVLPIGRVHAFSDWDGIKYLPGWVERRGKTLKHSTSTPGQFWLKLFATDEERKVGKLPKEIQFCQGACFAVRREAVWRREKKWWERLLREFERLDEKNPEEGHFMERFWYAALDEGVIVM